MRPARAGATIHVLPGPVTDRRAYELRERYHALFGGDEIPVPVESIAADLLGLAVHESDELGYSGVLIPATKEIWLNAADRARDGRPRFSLAHELGHWVCHCVGRRPEPIYCRPGDLEVEVDQQLEREANVFAAELLMPEPAVRDAWVRRMSARSRRASPSRRGDAVAALQLRSRARAPEI